MHASCDKKHKHDAKTHNRKVINAWYKKPKNLTPIEIACDTQQQSYIGKKWQYQGDSEEEDVDHRFCLELIEMSGII